MDVWGTRTDMEVCGQRTLRGLGYNIVHELAKGAFGTVFVVKAKDRDNLLAAKVTFPDQEGNGELKLWPTLEHENLLPLLNFHVREDVLVFLTCLEQCTLARIIERDIIDRNDSFDLVRQWLREVLCGLEYLHGLELCHFDLKKDNVLITHENTAVICDFGHLNVATRKTKFVGLPMKWRAPEAFCTDISLKPAVDGIPFDIWSFGILSLQTIMKTTIDIDYVERSTWLSVVYPKIYDVLQPPECYDMMKGSYPVAKITPEEMKQARNLIVGTLRHFPEYRPLVPAIMAHPFLSESRKRKLFMEDVLWKDARGQEQRRGVRHWFLRKCCCCIM